MVAKKKLVKKVTKKKAKKVVKKKNKKVVYKATRADDLRKKMAKLDTEYGKISDTCDINRTAFRDLEKELKDIKDDAIKKNGKTFFMTDGAFHDNDYSDSSDNIEYLIEELKLDGFCEDIVKVNVKVIKMTKEEQKKFEHYQSEYEGD